MEFRAPKTTAEMELNDNNNDRGNYDFVQDNGDQDNNGDQIDYDGPDVLPPFDIDTSEDINFGEFIQDDPNTNAPPSAALNASLDIDQDVVNLLIGTLDKTVDNASTNESLPADAKLVYVNPGFTKVMVNMTNYQTPTTARVILNSCYNYIKTSGFINKKLKVEIAIYPVAISNTSVYSLYLTSLCDYLANGYPIKPINNGVGIPIIKVGNNQMLVCGCCGIQINDAQIARHATDKVIAYQRFIAKKWSNCPWCNVDFENDEDALVHWYDENHTVTACRNIIGENDGNVNDARMHKGLPLPYTPFVQAAMSCFLQAAPLASIILCQRVTKIDMANTNELPACLSVEIAHMEKSDEWLPDCSICNERYYYHNAVHYSSIAAYDNDSSYQVRKCGHVIPTITKKFIGSIQLSIFKDMFDKMDGKKKKYGCATYKTSAKKDYYDDEGEMRKRFSTLFNSYNSNYTATSRQYSESVLQNYYYSQQNYSAVMYHHNRRLYDKYSGGIHIKVDGEDGDGVCFIEPTIDCDKMEVMKIFKKKNNGSTGHQIGKKTNVRNSVKVPVNSYHYAMSKSRLDFLAKRQGIIEYDMVKAQEYRVYNLPIAV